MGTSHWPFDTPKYKLTPNKLIRNHMECFEKYYNKTTENRKINWLFEEGKSTVSYSMYNKSASDGGELNKKIELNVSTVQMMILLLFNEYGDTIQVKDIMKYVSNNN